MECSGVPRISEKPMICRWQIKCTREIEPRVGAYCRCETLASKLCSGSCCINFLGGNVSIIRCYISRDPFDSVRDCWVEKYGVTDVHMLLQIEEKTLQQGC